MNSPRLAATLLTLASAAAATAQDPDPAYQKGQAYRFAGDTLARYEWTRNIPAAGGAIDTSRYRFQLRPRLELTFGPVELGAGGEFNYSDDENDVAPAGESLTIIRDNYRSRDVRLDLAWAKVTLGPFSAQGGRFFMPIPFTEMIWDRDLRPQGGAAKLQLGSAASPARLSLHGLYAFGSHVFDDEGDFRDPGLGEADPTSMWGGAAEISLGRAGESQLSVLGAYLTYDHTASLEPPIRRQNTRVAGLIVPDYDVWDIVARLTRGGQVPLQLVFDYCWNGAVSENNKGLWISAVLGAIGVSPGFTDRLLDAAEANDLPMLCGTSTPSDVMRLLERGYTVAKFFPAEVNGGVPALKGFGGPLPQMRFCPTGGISLKNAPDYLALPNVMCVGGSWVAPAQMVAEADWISITRLAAEAAALPR